jgi:uncharacterized protein YjiS (DUF1127 family)
MTTNAFSRAYGRIAGAFTTSANRIRDRRALATLPAHVLQDMGIDPDSVRAEPPATLPILMLMQR